MTGAALVWQFVPDLSGRRRALAVARGVVVVLAVVAASVGWNVGGLLGALIGIAVAALGWMGVESWGRSASDAGPQRLWVEGDRLRFEGPETFERSVDGDAFECERPGVTDAVIPLAEVDTIAVYPATTRGDGPRSQPSTGFHLVVDASLADGSRCCVVFDRRIPFRIAGERGLAEAVAAASGERWSDPPIDDPFGEVDRRRLADWHA